jgi:leucyl aminopeptidase
MKIQVVNSKKPIRNIDLLVVVVAPEKKKGARKKRPILEPALKQALGAAALQQLETLKFKAEHLESMLISSSSSKSAPSVKMAIGFVEDSSDSNRDRLNRYRALGAQISEQAMRYGAKRLGITGNLPLLGDDSAFYALSEGLRLSQYSYRRYKTDKKKDTAITSVLIETSKKISSQAIRRTEVVADEVMFARDMINTPANDLRPSHFVALCKERAKECGLTIEVFDSKRLQKLGAGGILGVGMGSGDQSYLVKLKYAPSKSSGLKKITYVGKAVTFDSGGLCIKNSMDTMKCDMSGGAATLAATCGVALLKLPVALTTYIPITENMINGDAIRPGDIITLLSGKTCEVLNTDAEGRLILADALHLAKEAKPDLMVDVATLTGACMVALGSKYAGLFSNNDALSDAIMTAGDNAGEAYWRLPLAPEYKKLLKSTVADYKNLFKEAGAVTAALFLQEFVGDIPWAHLDIAGPAFTQSDDGYIKTGGVGFAVRTLINLAEDLSR